MIDGTADKPETLLTPTRIARRRFLQLAGLSGVAVAASPLVAGPAGRRPHRAGAHEAA